MALVPAAAVGQGVDLVLNITDTPDPVPAGGVVTYEVRVTNDALATTATGNEVAVTVPAGMRYEGFTGPAGVSCSGMTVGADGPGALTCTLPNLTAGSIVEFDLRLRPLAAATYDVGFEVSGEQLDTEPANNTRTEQTTASAGSDLSVVITGPTEAASGATVSYNIEVQNAGPNATAGAITLQYPVPTGFVITGALPAGCSAAGGVITCTVPGPIASGSSVTRGPFTGQITVGSGSTVTHSASVTSGQDPIADNNVGTLSVTVTSGTDLRMVKARSRVGPYFVGEDISFVLTPTYTGDIPYGLEVVDIVPSNYTIRIADFAAVQGDWTCGVAGQTVTCTRPSTGLVPGANQALGPITIPVTITTAGNNVSNSATLSAADPSDPNPGNNTGSDGSTTLQVPTADLSIAKTGPNPALAVVGTDFTYVVTARNNGPMPFNGTLVVTDHVPEHLTITAVSGAGWSCTPVLPVAGAQNLVCSRVYAPGSPLASGANAPPITLTAVATAAGTITNSATVSSVDPNAPDGNLGNNTTSVDITAGTPGSAADLQVVKTVVAPDPVPAGEVLVYRIEMVNAGPQVATNVTMVDSLKSLINNASGPDEGFVGVTFASAGIVCTDAAAGTGVRRLSCTVPSVPICTLGTDCPYITVAVRPVIATTGARTNEALAYSADVGDPNTANNLGSVTSQVEARADVQVTKSGTPNPTPAGQDMVYVVTARNNGPSTAQGVVVVDSLPENMVFISATPSSGSCPVRPADGSVTADGNRVVSCNLGNLARNNQGTVTIRARPTFPTYNTTIENIARVSTTTTEPTVPGDTNNRATFSSGVTAPVVDLLINKIDLVDPVTVGDTTIYRVIVANNGPSDAENVVVTDSLPATGLSFQSLTISSGACSVVPAVGDEGGVIVCQISRLANGAADTLLVKMLGTSKGVRTNIARVSSDESDGGFDPNEANNRATENTTIRTRVDLEVVSKTPSTDPVALRVPFTWTLMVRNNSGLGLAEADQVLVSDNLPTGMELTGTPSIVSVVGGTISNNTCTGGAGSTAFTCDLGTMDSGTEVTISIPVRVVQMPAAPGTLTNTATIGSAVSQDVDTSNNSGSGTVTIVASTLSGSVFRDFNNNSAIDAGDTGIENVTMTLTGTAFDGSTVTRVVTTDANGEYLFVGLPAGTYTVSRGTPSEGHLVPGGQVVGDRSGNAAVVGDISGVVLDHDDDGTGYLFAFIPQARIGVAKALSPAAVLQADGSFVATFQILVRNHGLETLNNVVVTDLLAGAPSRFGTFVTGGAAATLAVGDYTIQTDPAIVGVCAGATINPLFDGSSDATVGSIASLAVGSSCTIAMAIRFQPTDPLPGGGYANQAHATGTGALSGQTPEDLSHTGTDPDPDSDGNPTNNNTPTPVPVVFIADVTSDVTLPATADADDDVHGTVMFRNAGPSAAHDVGYTLTMTPGLAGVVFGNLPVGAGASYNPITGVVTFTGMPTTLLPGQIASGDGTGPITFTYTQPGTATSTVTSGISTTTSQGANALPDTDSATVSGDLIADVTTVLDFPATADAGTTVDGTVVFTNVGPSTASGVTYGLELTPGLTGVTFGNLPAGAGASYDPATGVVTFTGMPTTVAPGAIASGNGTTGITVSYVQPGSATSSVVSTITTTTTEPSGHQPNQDDVTVSGNLIADVTTTITVPPGGDNVAAGETVIAQVTFQNNGPSTASGMTYQITLEPGLNPATVIFDNLPVGAVASYDPATGIVSFTGMPTTLASGAIASGNGTDGIEVRYPQIGTADSWIRSSVGTTTDQGANLAPDSAEQPTNGTLIADVTTSLSFPASADAGTLVSGTVRYTNLGPSVASDVSYSLQLTPGLSGVTFGNLPAGAGASYDPATGVVTFTGMPTTLNPSQIASGDGTGFITVSYVQPADAQSNVSSTIGTSTDEGANVGPNSATVAIPGNLIADVTTSMSFPASVNALQQVNGAVVFRNDGPSPAADVTYQLTMTPGLTNVAFGNLPAGATASYNPATGVVTFTGMPTTLAAGAMASGNGTSGITVQYDQPADGYSQVQSQIGTSTSQGTNPLPDQAIATVIGPVADVTVTVALPPSANAGDEVVAQISFSNNGPSTAENVTYQVMLPPGLTDVVIGNLPGGASASYDPVTGEVTFVGLPTTLAPGAGVPDIEIRYTQPGSGTSTVTGHIRTSTNQADNLAPDDASATVSGGLISDLRVTKVGPAGPVTAGADVVYTVRVDNLGPSDVTGSTLVDAPVGSIITAVACSAAAGNSCTTAPSPAVLGTGAVLPTIVVGGFYELTVTVRIGSVGTTISNTATVSPPPGVTDPTPENNTSTVTHPLVHVPVIGVAKRVSSLEPLAGGGYRVRFAISVRNYGSEALTNVEITDPLSQTAGGSFGTHLATGALTPGSYRVASVSAVGLTVQPAFNGDGSVVLATGSLAVGASASAEVVVDFMPTTASEVLFNQARATGTGATSGAPTSDQSEDGVDPDPDGDGDPDNNNVPTPILLPTIEVTKSLTDLVNRGDGRYDATFAITVRNLGAVPLTGVQIHDDLGQFGSHVVGTSPAAGEYAIVSAPAVTSALNGALLVPRPAGEFTGQGAGTAMLVAPSSVLPTTAAATMTFTLRFFPKGSGPFRNAAVAAADGPGGTTVTDSTDAPVDVPVDPQQIGVAKSAGEPVLTGARSFQVEYQIVVRNMSRTATATNVQVTDDLRNTFPTAQTIRITMAPRVGNCTGTVLDPDPAYDGVSRTTLLVGNQHLQPGESCIITFAVEVDFGAEPIPTTTFLNTAVATTADVPGGPPTDEDTSQNGTDPDPDDDGNPGNNEEPTPVVIVPDPTPVEGNFLITKSSALTNVAVGQLVPYTITVTNVSAAPAHGTEVRDVMPPGFRYRVGTGTVDGVAREPLVTGRTLSWNDLSFTPGETRVFRLVLVVGAGVGMGEHTNIAQAFGGNGAVPVSTIASATVRIMPDPVFECSEVIGHVFDDRNGNGIRDPGERGLAGVRLATARGWLVTTDADGRYHIACATAPDGERGSNFVLKIDESSLPTGYTIGSENPLAVRLTAGKMSEANFGAVLPRRVRVEMRDAAFLPGTTTLVTEWLTALEQVQTEVQGRSTVVELVLHTDEGNRELSRARLAAVAEYIRTRWREDTLKHLLRIEELLEMTSRREGGR